MMIWGAIVGFIMMSGFAYIIWALAAKDDSGMKMLGQVISCLIFLVAIVALIMGLMGKGHGMMMMGRGEWMEKGENPAKVEMMKEKEANPMMKTTKPTMKKRMAK